MKNFSLVLVLCLLLSSVACAQTAASAADVLCPDTVTELSDGALIDLDVDGIAEQIRYTVEEDPETGASAYTLLVGNAQMNGEGVSMTGRLHALRVSGAQDVLLLLSDYGWSDDDMTYIFSYYQGDLSFLGEIPTMPWKLSVNADGTLTGRVRGSILHTWFRPADFVLCTAYCEPDMALRTTGIVEMPRDLYPMGTKVTLLRDLPLCVSRTNDSPALTLRAGDTAFIAATDDIEWLYIVPDSHEYLTSETGAGWLRTDLGGYSASVNGQSVTTYELFEGLFYAD